MKPRRDLNESLEQYAHRNQVPCNYARPFWRAESLRLLGVKRTFAQASPHTFDKPETLCRIAPGVAVPTKETKSPEAFPEGLS